MSITIIGSQFPSKYQMREVYGKCSLTRDTLLAWLREGSGLFRENILGKLNITVHYTHYSHDKVFLSIYRPPYF